MRWLERSHWTCIDLNFGIAALHGLIDHHERGEVILLRVKDRFSEPIAAGWSDVMIAASNEALASDGLESSEWPHC